MWSDIVEHILLKMETKVNRMMGAFLEAQKDDPFYNSVEDDPTTPTFNIWGMICKDEMKRREEEAMNNVQTIIDNLEEEIQTQQIENDIEVDEKVVNNLQIAKRTIEDHNEVLWQVLDKIDVDKKLVEAKVQALKDNMKKKISELEKENDSYLLLIGKKEAENEKLRSELTSLRNFVAETSPEDQSNSLILKETQEKTVNLSDDSPLKTLDTFHKTPTTRSRKRQASDILLQNQDDGNMIQSLESVEKAHQVIIDIPSTGKKSILKANPKKSMRKKNEPADATMNQSDDWIFNNFPRNDIPKRKLRMVDSSGSGSKDVNDNQTKLELAKDTINGSKERFPRKNLKLAKASVTGSEDVGTKRASKNAVPAAQASHTTSGSPGPKSPASCTRSKQPMMDNLIDELGKTVTASKKSIDAVKKAMQAKVSSPGTIARNVGKRRRTSNVDLKNFTYDLREKLKNSRAEHGRQKL